SPAACSLPALAGSSAAKPGYNRDIRPILSENCFACHGPDKNQRKAKLRLDVREAALEKDAIVPGKPDKSELGKRIDTANLENVTPPPETHKMHVHDLHATMLYLCGIDHTRLTYRFQGRDFRLTDVAGNVAKGIVA